MKDQILKNLQLNGYPQKSVSLPLEKLYEVADNKRLNLNTILEELDHEGTTHTKTGDKIIFQSVSNESMMKKAQEMMGKMDPNDLKNMQEKVASMSSEEKENLMAQAKKMGLV